MESNSAKAFDILKIGLVIGGGFLAFSGIKKISEMFGFSKTESEKALAAALKNAAQDSTQIQDQSNPYVGFNPNYSQAIVTAWKKKNPGLTWDTKKQAKYTPEQYLEMAKRIANAPGISILKALIPGAVAYDFYNGKTFDDDEDVLYDVFRSIQTQWQLSVLSSFFSTFYKKDLLLFLKGFLSADEMTDLLNIVAPYPQYFK